MQANEVAQAVLNRASTLTEIIKKERVNDPEVSANLQVGIEAAKVVSELFIDAGLANNQTVIKYILKEIDLIDPELTKLSRDADAQHDISKSNELWKREYVAALQVGQKRIDPNFPDVVHNQLQTMWSIQNQEWEITT